MMLGILIVATEPVLQGFVSDLQLAALMEYESYAARSRCFLPSLNAVATASAGNIEAASDMSMVYWGGFIRIDEMEMG